MPQPKHRWKHHPWKAPAATPVLPPSSCHGRTGRMTKRRGAPAPPLTAGLHSCTAAARGVEGCIPDSPGPVCAVAYTRDACSFPIVGYNRHTAWHAPHTLFPALRMCPPPCLGTAKTQSAAACWRVRCGDLLAPLPLLFCSLPACPQRAQPGITDLHKDGVANVHGRAQTRMRPEQGKGVPMG